MIHPTRIERRTVGHAYPQNGNVHRPTPRYAWAAYHDGQLIGYGMTYKRQAVELLGDIGVAGPIPVVRLP